MSNLTPGRLDGWPRHAGALPLHVTLGCAAESWQDSYAISSYEINWGDGAGWEEIGLASSVEHSYAAAGYCRPRLRVTDERGVTDVDWLELLADRELDEVEPNDRVEQWLANPALQVGGSCRGQVGLLETDGLCFSDYDDYYRVESPGAGVLTIRAECGESPLPKYMALYQGTKSYQLASADSWIAGLS